MKKEIEELFWVKPKILIPQEDNPRRDFSGVDSIREDMKNRGYDKDYPILVAELTEDYITSKGKLLKKGDLVIRNGQQRQMAAIGVLDFVAIKIKRMTYLQAWKDGANANFRQHEYKPLEMAGYVGQLYQMYQNNSKIARELNIDESTVRMYLSLLKTHPEVQEDVNKGKITSSIASLVSRLPEHIQVKVAKHIAKHPELYTRDSVRRIVKTVKGKSPDTQEEYLSIFFDEIEGVPKPKIEEKAKSLFGDKFKESLKVIEKEKKLLKLDSDKEVDKLIEIEKDMGYAFTELNSMLVQRENYLKDKDLKVLLKSKKGKMLRNEIKKNKGKEKALRIILNRNRR